MIKHLRLATAMVGFLIAGSAVAGVIQVGSQAALGANDEILWSQLGVEFTSIASPADVVSTGGLSATVTDSNGNMERRDQGTSWVGGFPNGATLLWNAGAGTLTIDFDQAVMGFGALISSDNFGDFTAQVLLGGGLGTFSVNGNNISNIPYLGVLSDAADITSVTFSNITNGESFAIGNLDLKTVPEPATLALMGLGLAGLGLSRRKTKSN